MGAIEDFQKAIELLRGKIKAYETERGDIHVTEEQDAKDAEVMSDTNNWCCVHATRYMPKYDKDDSVVIPSTAMATNCEIPRQTVHFTLNHVVESHSGGRWDDCPYVVFCPYKNVVAQNGNPVGLCLADTYFSTDVDVGMVLPKESTYMVQPSSDSKGELYTIGEHVAAYKTDNFTDAEIARILSLLSPQELKEYNRLMNGDLDKHEIKSALGTDPRIKRWYENAQDKKLFLKGLMEEERMVILTSFLRDAVVRLAMDKKGFQYIDDALYRAGGNNYVAESRTGRVVEEIAISKKIPTNTGAHYFSAYGEAGLQGCYEKFSDEIEEIITEKNMDKLLSKMVSINSDDSKMWVIDVITNNVFPDNYYDAVYEPAFQKFKDSRMEEYNRHSQDYNDKHGYVELSVQQCATIQDFDPKLSKALRKNVVVMNTKLRKWRAQMQNNPKFKKLLEKWNNYVSGNFEDLDEFIKPSIEQQFAQPQRVYQTGGRNM